MLLVMYNFLVGLNVVLPSIYFLEFRDLHLHGFLTLNGSMNLLGLPLNFNKTI